MENRFKIIEKNGKKYFFRFTVNQRFQHILLATLVIVLVLTGMPLKFHQASWASYVYALFGGIRVAPVVHKIAGTMLVLLFVYHLIYLVITFYRGEVIPLRDKKELSPGQVLHRLVSHPIVPNLKDLKDIIHLLKYLLFLTNKRPEGAMFTWKEKFDYWGPFWGIAIMGSSGLIMWNKEFFTLILPGETINFALIAHSDEALLAALFLFIWHFYNVHFSTSVFPMDTVFITGYLSEDMMVEEHYEYYKEIMKVSGFEHEILPPHGFSKEKIKPDSARDNPGKVSDLSRV
jgi:cytochrome b subunit of formate dehydrogenase